MIVSLRERLSLSSLLASAHFARQTRALELARDAQPFEPACHLHRAYALGAITMAAVGVEGTINEVWADAAEPDTDQLSPLPIANRAKLRGLWPKKERKETWWKYNRVLRELGKQEFSPEEPRSQALELLLELRNSFVHYKPTWQTRAVPHELEQTELATLGRHAFVSEGNPFFPGVILGHGGASWAIRVALAFTDEFFRRLGVPALYENYRSQLAVE